MKPKAHWYDYLWIWTIAYFVLGFFNILFAWLGMIDFLLPLLFAVFGGNKWFCNHLCGRGQLLTVLPFSRRKPAPRWLSSPWFRYAFLAFFLTRIHFPKSPLVIFEKCGMLCLFWEIRFRQTSKRSIEYGFTAL